METNFDYEYNRRLAIVSLTQQMAIINDRNAATFVAAAAGWKIRAGQNHDLGIPIPEKPIAMLKAVVKEDASGWPIVEWGPDRVGDPVPDIVPVVDPVVTGPEAIGMWQGGNIYSSVYGDNSPAGTIVIKDGARYRKCRSPFGGWWKSWWTDMADTTKVVSASFLPGGVIVPHGVGDTNVGVHGPYEDALIALFVLIGKVIDGQPPETKKALWDMYVEDAKAWRAFWSGLMSK